MYMPNKYPINNGQLVINYNTFIAKSRMRKYHIFHKLNSTMLQWFSRELA